MRKINAKASLDTLIRIEATLKELLNISSAIGLTTPLMVIEHMKDMYKLTEDEARNIAVKTRDIGTDKYVTHELFKEIRKILNEYGYEFELSNIKENQSNDQSYTDAF